MQFGSWAYSMKDVDIRPIFGNISLKHYIPDGEWDITETSCIRNEVPYDYDQNEVSPFAYRPNGNP